MTFTAGNTPDFASIYGASATPAATTQPDLMAELAQIGVTSLAGLTDAQLQDIASRLTAHRAQVIAAQQAATAPAGQATPVDTAGMSSQDALLAKYPALAGVPKDSTGTINYGSAPAVPGMGGLSPADQAAWTAKLGGNFTNVGSPDPAQELAQALYHQQNGIQGTAYTAQDQQQQLAFAKAYAAQAGVTSDQLAAAQAQLQAQGGIEGSSAWNQQVAQQYRRDNAGLEPGLNGVVPSNAAEYVKTLRATPGTNAYTGLSNADLATQLEKNWGLTTAAAPAATPAATTAPATAAPAPAAAPKPAASTAAPASPAAPMVTQPASTAVDPAKLATLDKYITNLSAVKAPTAAQSAELATYQARKIEYAGRG